MRDGRLGGFEQQEVIGRCLSAAFNVERDSCFAPLIAALDALENKSHAAQQERKWWNLLG